MAVAQPQRVRDDHGRPERVRVRPPRPDPVVARALLAAQGPIDQIVRRFSTQGVVGAPQEEGVPLTSLCRIQSPRRHAKQMRGRRVTLQLLGLLWPRAPGAPFSFPGGRVLLLLVQAFLAQGNGFGQPPILLRLII